MTTDTGDVSFEPGLASPIFMSPVLLLAHRPHTRHALHLHDDLRHLARSDRREADADFLDVVLVALCNELPDLGMRGQLPPPQGYPNRARNQKSRSAASSSRTACGKPCRPPR
jgi:hypothetical protein